MSEADDIAFFRATLAASVRTMPLSEALRFLRGALLVAAEDADMTEIRNAYIRLQSCDQQLELLAAPQMTLPLADDGAAAVKVPFRNDTEPAYYAYRCEAVAEGMEPLSIENWSEVRGLKPVGSLGDLEREYDHYRKERGEAFSEVLTLTQFLPVWRQYRLGRRPQEWIAGAIHEAELAHGLRSQAVS